MKKPKLLGKASVLSVIMAAALLLLAGVLIKSAVSQFSAGQWFSGCVSILGTILIVVVCVMLTVDVKKKNAKRSGEQ